MSNPTDAPGMRKPCSKCGEVKPLEDFSYDKRHADGRQSQCKACACARQKKYAQENRELHLQRKRDEYQRNKARYLATLKAYREANRNDINRRAKERKASLSPEELEKFRAGSRERSTRYRLANLEAVAARIRAWQQANPDKCSDAVNRRRARMYGNGRVEDVSRAQLGKRDGWLCGICREPIDPRVAWPDQMSASVDHVIPLSHGGEHTYVNCRIAHWICNVRRGADRATASCTPPSGVAV